MPADNEMSGQPDEVEEVDSSAQSLAMAPPARNLWKFRDELLALDCVKHNLRLLQSEDYRRIFPNFPEMDDQVWLTLNTKLNDSIATAESFFRQVNDSNWPTMPVTGVPGAGTGGGNVGSEQSSEDMLLIRRYEETTVKLQDTVGFLSQVLVGHHRNPTDPMRIQAPVRTPRVRRPTRSQLPRLRLDRERNYSTLLNPAFIPRPVRNNHRQTECSPLNERYRVFLCLHKGPMPRRSTPIREQHPKYPRLVAAEHMPLDQVPQERGSSPVELPPVAVLAGELDASEGGHVDESPDGDVEMKDDNSTSKDVLVDDESSKPLDKLPGISEVFANDDFMEEDFSGGQKRIRPAEKRDFDYYVAEQAYNVVQPFLTKTMSQGDQRVTVHDNHETGEVKANEHFPDRTRTFDVAGTWKTAESQPMPSLRHPELAPRPSLGYTQPSADTEAYVTPSRPYARTQAREPTLLPSLRPFAPAQGPPSLPSLRPNSSFPPLRSHLFTYPLPPTRPLPSLYPPPHALAPTQPELELEPHPHPYAQFRAFARVHPNPPADPELEAMSSKARGKLPLVSNRIYKPMERGESSRSGAGSGSGS